MVKAENIISEVHNYFKKESQAGNIDNDSLYRNLLKAFKRYGNDVMVQKEEIIQIENYNATLPEDVFALLTAFKCSPCGIDTEIEYHDLIRSDIYVERVSKDTSWNTCAANSCQTMTESVVRENVYFKNYQKSANFIYGDFYELKISKGFVRKDESIQKMLDKNFVRDNGILKWEGRAIQTGFKSGYVFVQYKGVPTDEDGVLQFEDTPSSSLSDALIAEVIYDITPELILAGGPTSQQIANMSPLITASKKEKRNLAANEVKMINFTYKDQREIRRGMSRRAQKYEIVRR